VDAAPGEGAVLRDACAEDDAASGGSLVAVDVELVDGSGGADRTADRTNEQRGPDTVAAAPEAIGAAMDGIVADVRMGAPPPLPCTEVPAIPPTFPSGGPRSPDERRIATSVAVTLA
jgi:hypothetical protein